jgi:EAL domain-containing protein (putative c-di-GMP-specific phosphodiesterase class I)
MRDRANDHTSAKSSGTTGFSNNSVASTAEPRWRRRHSSPLIVAGITLAIATLVTTAYGVVSHALMVDRENELLSARAEQAEAELDVPYRAAESVLRQLTVTVESLPNIDDAQAALPLLHASLRQARVRNPYIVTLAYASVGGTFAGARQDSAEDDNASWMATNSSDRTTLDYGFMSTTGEVLAPAGSLQQYDPRTRPWYTIVGNESGPRWTAVYANKGPTGALTTSVSINVERDGMIVGVASLDMDLEQVNILTKEVAQNASATLALIDERGLLVASSREVHLALAAPNQDEYAVRLRPAGTNDPVLADEGDRLAKTADNEILRTEQWAGVTLPLRAKPDQRLLVLIRRANDPFALWALAGCALWAVLFAGLLALQRRATDPFRRDIEGARAMAEEADARRDVPRLVPATTSEGVQLGATVIDLGNRLHELDAERQRAQLIVPGTDLEGIDSFRTDLNRKVRTADVTAVVIELVDYGAILSVHGALAATNIARRALRDHTDQLRQLGAVYSLGSGRAAVISTRNLDMSAVRLATATLPGDPPTLVVDDHVTTIAPRAAIVQIPRGSSPEWAWALVEAAEATTREGRHERVRQLDRDAVRSVARRMSIAADLQADLGQKVFPVFQPVMELATGALESFEALARYNHHSYGSVPPDEFIPLAQIGGFLDELDLSILAKALDDAQMFGRSLRTGFGLHCNTSSMLLSGHGACDRIAKVVEDSGFELSRLVIEITESAELAVTPQLVRSLEELRASGVKVALDDFGVGYSAFGMLHELPIDVVKLDRSLIRCIHTNAREQATVRAIVELSDALGISLVAEGIEHAEQRRTLLNLGCRLGQGYALCRPMPLEDYCLLANAQTVSPQELWLEGN